MATFKLGRTSNRVRTGPNFSVLNPKTTGKRIIRNNQAERLKKIFKGNGILGRGKSGLDRVAAAKSKSGATSSSDG